MTERPNLPEDLLSSGRAALNGFPVLVTGATGFIGRRLVEALLVLGADVSVVLRSRHGAKAFRERGVRVCMGQLSDVNFLNSAFEGKFILFHLAYDVRAGGKANLDVFGSVLEAFEASKAARIVHLSSLVVYDDWPNGPIDEASKINRTGALDYRDAKIAMEEALVAGSKPAAILQPGIVFGPGSALWTDRPRAALRRGPVILPDPVGLCPAIHVDDVVQAALRAAIVPDLGREKFVLNGPPAMVDLSALFSTKDAAKCDK